MPTGTDDAARRKRRKFRELLRREKLTVMPGGFSPLFARMAEAIGFESFFVAGSQVSAFLYGVPDNGIIGLRDIVDHARHVAAQTEIPILLDTDTGFGNAVNVYFTVEECIRAGVAAIHIEDQEAPKKSGTVAGRRCIPIDEAVGKFRAAAAARDALDPDFVICARCDALGAEGLTFEDALERCRAYATDGRADLIWLNSVETREQAKRVCAEVPAPVLVIWGGPAPAPTPEEYQRLGVRIALYPTIAATFALHAAWHGLNDFKARGAAAIVEFAGAIRAKPWGIADRNALVRTDLVREIEEQFLPEAQRRDYAGTWGHKEAIYRDVTKPVEEKK